MAIVTDVTILREAFPQASIEQYGGRDLMAQALSLFTGRVLDSAVTVGAPDLGRPPWDAMAGRHPTRG
jgi:hypothetical protein